MPRNVKLVQLASGSFSPDTADAIRKLEARAAQFKIRMKVSGRGMANMTWDHVRQDPGPTGLPPEYSAVPTGREVYLSVQQAPEQDEAVSAKRERELAMLWGIAVPMGFVPFARYPLPGPTDTVFHFFGAWALLLDNLLGAGRGEAGWPAFCCAAQLEVGKWEGPRGLERMVQAHLHRLGFNVGALDGVIGPKTQGALRAANLHSMPMTEVAEKISTQEVAMPRTLEKPLRGRVELTDVDFSIHPYGQVRTTRTIRGADLHISGPGRIVIDFRDPA